MEGEHHLYLDPKVKPVFPKNYYNVITGGLLFPSKKDWEAAGIVDDCVIEMKADIQNDPNNREIYAEGWKKYLLLEEEDKSVPLLIDTNYPTKRILDSVNKILVERKKKNTRSTTTPASTKNVPSGSKYKYPEILAAESLQVQNVKERLQYFRCYDLFKCTDKSHGKVAEEVYGKKKERKKSEDAVKRVEQLIKEAEAQTPLPT